MLHNFTHDDYITVNELGAAGYIMNEDSLLLSIGLNTDFSCKPDISHLEQRNVIDRMLKSLSNLAPNNSMLSPKDHLNYMIKQAHQNVRGDFF